MHRVPDDGDCFFSSIKAALEDSVETMRGGGRESEVTVATMRDWVAEETGEEQLAFYELQAKAHPEDRW